MLAIARALEDGRLRGPMARLLSRAWAGAASRSVVRPLVVPVGVRVVAVGGSTLGGSGKTPLAVACARHLARGGARVALVGHAYRAHPGFAREVSADDRLEAVGDEALVAARTLEAHGVRVFVGPSRGAAVMLAARGADFLVLDGVLQTRPARAWLSLLSVDADEPWGHARAVPPCGDLRAPVHALLAATDQVVTVGEAPADAHIVSGGARVGAKLLSWDELRSLRVGLACSLGRPDRVVRFLSRRDVRPVVIARALDHSALDMRALRSVEPPVDLWLASAKCALHVAPTRAPLATIDHALALGPALAARLAGRRAP
jgi:tetraacyldisaccharide 4'-kinase